MSIVTQPLTDEETSKDESDSLAETQSTDGEVSSTPPEVILSTPT